MKKQVKAPKSTTSKSIPLDVPPHLRSAMETLAKIQGVPFQTILDQVANDCVRRAMAERKTDMAQSIEDMGNAVKAANYFSHADSALFRDAPGTAEDLADHRSWAWHCIVSALLDGQSSLEEAAKKGGAK